MQELRHKQVRCTSSTSSRLATVPSSLRPLLSSMVFSTQLVTASRLDPNNLSSSRDMANNQLPRHRLLPFLASHNNCLLNHHSSTRRALTLHKRILPNHLRLPTILFPLALSLEWLQANLVLTNQDQVLRHLLQVP